MFQGQVQAHYQSESVIDSSTLKKMLDDAMDAVFDGPRAAEPAAFMAPQARVSGLDDLPVVDILEDPGIWACLDEGCNSNCHGKIWRENAEMKLDLRNSRHTS